MADLVLDTFSTGTPGDSVTTRTGDSGVTWGAASGDFKLRAGGGCYPTGATAIVYADVNVAQDMEVDATLDVVTQPSPANCYCGVSVSASADGNNYVNYLFNYAGAATLLCYSNVSGSPTEIASWIPGHFPQLAVGEHPIRWARNGTLFRGWLDRRELFRIKINSPPSQNRVAMQGGNATSTTGVHIKRFAARQTSFDTNQVQFVGDSMTACDYYDEVGAINQVPRPNQWPTRVMDLLFADGFDGLYANAGVDGQTAATIITDLNTTKTTDALPHRVNLSGNDYGWGTQACRHANAEFDVVVFMVGINDLVAAASAATVLGRIEIIASTLRTAGFKAVVMTLPEGAEGVGSIPAGFNAKVGTINAGIVAGAANYDGIVRTDLVEEANDYSNATYRSQYDGIHWLPATQPFIAQAVYEVVSPLVTPPPPIRWVGGWPGAMSGNSPFNLSPFIC